MTSIMIGRARAWQLRIRFVDVPRMFAGRFPCRSRSAVWFGLNYLCFPRLGSALATLAVACGALVSEGIAAPGDLDTSFNGIGKVTTAIRSGDDVGYSAALQSDGKIVVAG